MTSYAMQDLRHRVLRFNELQRRHRAGDKLSPVELKELENGIDAVEYKRLLDTIIGERRNATPSKKAKERTASVSVPIDLNDFEVT